MKYSFVTLLFFFIFSATQAQSPGDTIRVQAFTFDNDSRDMVVNFPDDPNVSYEKILLKYTMRCTDGLVSTGTDRNLGCGEWDYSCNTYLADSSKTESILTDIPSHLITNFADTIFPYKETPVYDYMRGTQSDVQILSTNSETDAAIVDGSDPLNRILSTDHVAGSSQYLYTAAELSSAGLTAGAIEGMSLNVLSDAGEAKYLKIKIKPTVKTELNGLIDTDDFTDVYYNNTTLTANQSNRFQFHNPFIWDGSSNIIVAFNFTNVDAGTLSETLIAGGNTGSKMSLSSTDEKEIILTNNAYIEANDYTGIGGTQNRTIEAWIKTTDGSRGEIMAWGAQTTGSKFTFRLVNGRLRLEVHGGGTESTTTLNDGQWHHVACVFNGSSLANIRFYVDGVLDVNQVTGTTAINTNGTEAKLRVSRGLNNRYLNATIDDVRLWSTNLSQSTINEWKNLKVDNSHPNYSSLQLNYEFNDDGNQIVDSSPFGRNGTLIGDRFSLSEVSGESLFKDYILGENRPNITFYQGDYVTDISTTTVDRPMAKEPRHLVIERTIVPTDPNIAKDDDILIDGPRELWLPEENIYDELTGDLIITNALTPDGEIIVQNLEYTRRFPFYNELVSFVTPYGIGLDLGLEGASWNIDMSDYVTILKGNKRLLMTLGGQNQEQMDLEFLFIVGTPPRDVLQYEQIWQGTNRLGIANINQIINDEKFSEHSLLLNANASTFKLKSSITGHGAQGEFQQNGGQVNHRILVDQSTKFNWTISQECSLNPIYPQGGTWVYDRQGWCPGERTFMNEQDLTPLVTAGSNLNIDYVTSPPPNSTGDYRYHVAHQVVGYGEANFQSDAAVVSIIAPNNTAEFTRVGTICANPMVVIRNTGATELTNLTINYWLNDSQSPQTYEWEGNLEFMEDETVEIPSPAELWFDILAENNRFYVEISNPNQGTDEYAFNNKMSSTFNVPAVIPHNLTVELRTNNLPTENFYQLIDGSGNLVGANNLPTANTVYSDDYELTDQCYKLIVRDLGGDGLQWWANAAQGTGYIRFRDNNGSVVRTFQPDFGSGFEFSFNTTFVLSSEELDFLTSIKVSPNPSSDYCTIEADDLLKAKIHMTDLSGKTVYAPILSQSNKSVSLNVRNLISGIYLVVIQKDEVLTTRKVVIK